MNLETIINDDDELVISFDRPVYFSSYMIDEINDTETNQDTEITTPMSKQSSENYTTDL